MALTAGLVFAAGPVQAAPPPQEPGVTLRVFDVQVPLTADLHAQARADPQRRQADADRSTGPRRRLRLRATTSSPRSSATSTSPPAGSVHVPAHQRRRLAAARSTTPWSSTTTACTAPPPKDGTVTLTTGYHALRIDHFERDGGQQLTLDWRPPGATGVRARAQLGAEHRRRRGAGDRARPQGVRGRHRLPRRRPAADRGAPELHADQPAARPASSRRSPAWTGSPTAGWRSPPGAARDNVARRGLHPRQRHRQHRPEPGDAQEDRHRAQGADGPQDRRRQDLRVGEAPS